MRAPVCRPATRAGPDFENGLVLLIGWVIALAVTWT